LPDTVIAPATGGPASMFAAVVPPTLLEVPPADAPPVAELFAPPAPMDAGLPSQPKSVGFTRRISGMSEQIFMTRLSVLACRAQCQEHSAASEAVR